ncbi:ATP:cob(I)alamin adenosyltransferase, partial [Citrobacter braakii]|uniref:ATP:cob(I)alamin adenosyltransferase n=1 Tax=Citrobacter braakii TaxID=57706 RepID=UPI0039842001
RIDSSKPTCRQNRCCKNGSDHRFRFPSGPQKGLARLQQRIGEEDIQALEQLIDRNMAQSGPLKEFVIPGKNLPSAQLHVARTLTRRLERILIAMSRTLTLRDEPRRYINRLSDALFSMARIEETSPDACA